MIKNALENGMICAFEKYALYVFKKVRFLSAVNIAYFVMVMRFWSFKNAFFGYRKTIRKNAENRQEKECFLRRS